MKNKFYLYVPHLFKKELPQTYVHCLNDTKYCEIHWPKIQKKEYNLFNLD
jgi:hypothetical protein